MNETQLRILRFRIKFFWIIWNVLSTLLLQLYIKRLFSHHADEKLKEFHMARPFPAHLRASPAQSAINTNTESTISMLIECVEYRMYQQHKGRQKGLKKGFGDETQKNQLALYTL